MSIEHEKSCNEPNVRKEEVAVVNQDDKTGYVIIRCNVCKAEDKRI